MGFADDFVDNDAFQHAEDFALVLNDCSDKNEALRIFIENINVESRIILEDEMGLVI